MPANTCFDDLLDYLHGHGAPYAKTATLCGVWCLFIFLLSFCLCGRVKEKQEEEGREANYEDRGDYPVGADGHIEEGRDAQNQYGPPE